ncbi:MAG: hypothetical protein RBR16_13465 [Syntrophus sp. (in: bacteria)]|nr:hypothetical protein [Syntrophus sp. (in: bacteria)]
MNLLAHYLAEFNETYRRTAADRRRTRLYLFIAALLVAAALWWIVNWPDPVAQVTSIRG